MKDIECALEQRAIKIGELEAITNKAIADSRELTEDEQSKFDGIEASVKTLDGNIERLREIHASKVKAEAMRVEAEKPVGRPAILPPAPADHINRGYSIAEERSLRTYSYAKVLTASSKPGTVLDGLEGEMEQMAKSQGHKIDPGHFHIPFEMLSQKTLPQPPTMRFRNDLTAGTADAGKELIDTSLLSPIDIYYHYQVIPQLGVDMRMGLRPNQTIPVMKRGTPVPSAKAENADATELVPTTDDITLSPKRVPVYSTISQQLDLQQSVGGWDVNTWVMNFIMRMLAETTQDLFINGTGSSNQPQGISAGLPAARTIAFGANANAGGAPTRAKILQMVSSVDEENALMGSLAFLTNSKVKYFCKEVKIDTGSGYFLWDEEHNMSAPVVGHRALITNQVKSNLNKGTYTGADLSAIFFGDWSQSLLAQWGGLNVLTDPYSQSKKGLVDIHASIYLDVKVLRQESFTKVVDAKL